MRELTEAGVAFLTGERAQARLAELDGDGGVKAVEALRQEGFDADQAAWLLGQATLRRRARGKLPQPERLLLTGEALEQASGLAAAGWRASRLADRGEVLELGAGVGGDTLALAAAGLRVRAVERDPVRAALLRHNVAALALGDRVEVIEADWTARDWTGASTAYADPARRIEGKRVTRLDRMVPPLQTLEALAGVVPGVLAKVAPGLDPREVPAHVGLEFVSVGGELKEALLTWGELRAGGGPRAVVLPGPHVLSSDEPEPPPRLAEPGAVFYEPDPALLRAGLVRQLGATLDAWQLDPTIAFLSAAAHQPTPFARAFRVLRWGPFQRKALAKWLRAEQAGELVIRRRGVPIEPEVLRKKLPTTRGGKRVWVFLTRGPGGPVAVVAEPLEGVG